MITEFAIGATIVYSINYIKNAPCRNIGKKFDDIVYECKLGNKTGESYKLWNIKKTDYGFSALINVPKGMDLDKLQGIKNIIAKNMKCLVEIENPALKDFGYIKFITAPQDTFNFEPVETKEYELLLGYRPNGSKYIINLNLDPQLLIGGKTGTGKSFLFASIITNLIYFHKKHVEIYLFQVMKGEVDIFADCPGVKFASDIPQEILYMLKKINDIIHKRSKQFAENGIKNITQWNTHFPKKSMKRIIIGVEEISFFMQEEKEEKEDGFFQYFNNIVKAGRSAGVHFICLTQRTTAVNLGGNGELKSQLTVITAKQRTEADSRNAIDIDDAAFLDRQEFIASANDGYVRFKAPIIDEDYKILNKFVPEIRIPKINIKDEKKKSYSSVLSYDESQKLKTNSEFYVLKKEETKLNENIEIIEPVKEKVEAPIKLERKKRVPKRKGAIRKEDIKEVTMEDERNGL